MGSQRRGRSLIEPQADGDQDGNADAEQTAGREFSVNVARGCYHCPKCNQFALGAAAIGQPMHPATIELRRQLGHEVSRLQRW